MAPARTAEPSPERERICGALVELVGERGYPEITVEELRRRAAVDAGTFKRHFTGLEDCFAATWDEANAELERRIFRAVAAQGSWRDRVRAGLGTELRFLAEDPARARLYVSDAVFAGPELRARGQAAMERLADLIDLGRRELPDPERVPRDIAIAIAGAIWARANYLIRHDRSAELEGQLPELMHLLVLPYLGSGAAREELGRSLG